LIHASLDSNEYDIKKWTAGVMFFGTPHQGTSTASLGSRFLQFGSFFFHTNLALIQQLEKDSDFLGMQMRQYRPICTDFESYFFYEAFKTPVSRRGWLSIQVSRTRRCFTLFPAAKEEAGVF
jgi:triacylglycerol esterase/lipase EstA (alpha/beta hydrolase family)